MALTINQLNAITSKKFIPKLVDNIFDSNTFLERMKRKGLLLLDGGESIRMPLMYAQTSSSGFYEGADILDTTDNDQFTGADYDWKFGFANITIKETDILKNSGVNKEVDLVKSKVMAAEKTLMDVVGTSFWNTGAIAKNVHGLRFLLSTSNTVGGISQTDNSWWQSNVSTATVVTMATLNGQYTNATWGSDVPSVGYTTRSIYNLYYALLQPQQRFQDVDTAKAGFSSLMFNGKPIIVDSHAPSGHLAFVNEDYMKFILHKDQNFVFDPFVKPTNQHVKAGKVYFAGNLGISNAKRHALFTSLAS